MASDPRDTTSNPPPIERPWQFSLLHLFGLTTLVAVCAGAFFLESRVWDAHFLGIVPLHRHVLPHKGHHSHRGSDSAEPGAA
jgi:hypothetical protein